MKKIVTVMTVLALCAGCTAGSASAAGSEPGTAHTLESRSVPVYHAALTDTGPAEDMILMPDLTLYYADGVNDLPYVDL